MPNEVVDGLSNQIPVLAIGANLTLSNAGQYGLAIMMLSAPAALVGQALGQAFLRHVSRDQSDPLLIRRFMIRIWLALAAVGVIPFTTVFLFGDLIFGFAFGSSWREAGVIAALMAPLSLARFISSPTSGVYLRFNMQKANWRFCVLAAGYRSAAYAPLVYGVALKYCIILHVVFEVMAIIAYNVFAMMKLARSPSSKLATSL
jgi:O-antigen/teichoic acid export membrane protein